MVKIRLSRKAIADLDGIWDYTSQTLSEEYIYAIGCNWSLLYSFTSILMWFTLHEV